MNDITQLREDATLLIKKAWYDILNDSCIGTTSTPITITDVEHDTSFHEVIWYASTEILPNLEVQVVIDSNNKCHVSTGSAGYVDFQINPVGMKLPIKCWIHTHPFGSAYFSGTDWRTVNTWKPLMKCAYVLGSGRGHYGFWMNGNSNILLIYDENNDTPRVQKFSTQPLESNESFEVFCKFCSVEATELENGMVICPVCKEYEGLEEVYIKGEEE